MISRRLVTVAVAGLTVFAVTACGLETTDETEKEKSQVQGLDFSVGPIDVRDAYLVYPTSSPTAPYLVATFVNEGPSPDSLAGVTIPSATVAIGGTSGISSGLTLPPGVVVQVSDPDIVASDATLAVTPSSSPPAVGDLVSATFAFAQAGTSAEESIPVIPAGETLDPTQLVPTNQEPAPTESGDKADD